MGSNQSQVNYKNPYNRFRKTYDKKLPNLTPGLKRGQANMHIGNKTKIFAMNTFFFII